MLFLRLVMHVPTRFSLVHEINEQLAPSLSPLHAFIDCCFGPAPLRPCPRVVTEFCAQATVVTTKPMASIVKINFFMMFLLVVKNKEFNRAQFKPSTGVFQKKFQKL